ncbi:MAG: hypothetical protein ACOX3K_03715 [Bacilli bacterium]|jgi:hypothetical protein
MKTNKIKTKLLIMITGLACLWSAGLTLPTNNTPQQAEAAVLPTGKIIYLHAGTDWAKDGAVFAVDFVRGTGETRVHMTPVADVDHTYMAATPAGASYSMFQFFRLDPNNLNNVWNYTATFTYDGTNDFYQITSAGNNPTYTKTVFVDPRIPVGTKLYVYPDATFKGANFNHMAAYFFRDGTPVDQQWVTMSEDSKQGVYAVTVPATSDAGVTKWKGVIFVSLSNAENNWSYKINQTADLTYEVGKTLYELTGTPGWKPYESLILKTPTTLGISRYKVRVWLDRNQHYVSGYEYLLTVNGTYYSWSAEQLSATDTYNDFYFVYYDLPLSVLAGQSVAFTIVDSRGYQVQTVAGTTYVAGTPTAAGDNSKIWRVNEAAGSFTLTKGALDSSYTRFYRGLLAAALEGYLSCDGNTDNGYGAFPAIDSNFILRNPDGSWKTMGYLSDRTILDFDTISDYETGNKTVTINAQAKYDMLKKMYEASQPAGFQPYPYEANDNTAGILILAVLFSLTTIGYLGFYKKKRA